MRRRNIKTVLRKKIDQWIANIDDPKVVEAIKQDCIVSGGSIASLLMGEQVNDYDVYFRTQDAALTVAKHYVQKFKENPPQRFKDGGEVAIKAVKCRDHVRVVVKSQGIAGESGTESYEYFEQNDDDTASESFIESVVQDATEAADSDDKAKYRPRFLSSNAITLSDRIQVVTRFCGEPAELHKNYDFIHCMCAWDYASGELHISQDAVESMLSKHLSYQGSLYPICSMIRTRKFLARGWTIDAGQYVKMAWQTSKLDLENFEVLRDQMVGVDAAYFYQVLELLRANSSGDKVDGTYLMQVIDKVFA